jgi:hypothetical protein
MIDQYIQGQEPSPKERSSILKFFWDVENEVLESPFRVSRAKIVIMLAPEYQMTDDEGAILWDIGRKHIERIDRMEFINKKS